MIMNYKLYIEYTLTHDYFWRGTFYINVMILWKNWRGEYIYTYMKLIMDYGNIYGYEYKNIYGYGYGYEYTEFENVKILLNELAM